MSSSPFLALAGSSPRGLSYALVACAAILLSACGGGGGSGGGEVTPPPPTDGPDLMVSVSLPSAEIPSGHAQTLAVVKLSNHGKGVAGSSDVNITADALLQDLKIVNCKSDNPATLCPASASRMTVSNLQAGATLSWEVYGMVKPGSSSRVNLEASASTGSGTHLSSSKMAVGFKAFAVDMALEATGPTSAVPPGGSFDYVLTASNKGPDTAKNVLMGFVVLSQAPANALVAGPLSCTATGGAVCPTELSASPLVLPSVPNDGSLVFKLPYTLAPGVTTGLVFEAGVKADGDSVSSNNNALIITP